MVAGPTSVYMVAWREGGEEKGMILVMVSGRE